MKIKLLLISFFLIVISPILLSAATIKTKVSIYPDNNNNSKSTEIKPPVITIISPELTRSLKVVLKDKKFVVRGKAESGIGVYDVTVNSESASLDEKGYFSSEILLKPGENLVKVVATDVKKKSSDAEFYIVRQSDETVSAVKQEKEKSITIGKFYALIIAIEDYKDSSINRLDYPIIDASNIYETLNKKYNFDETDIIFLKNPDRKSIIDHLDQLANQLGEDDSLIIFYAGHGHWDEKMKQGFWLPSNAKAKSRAEWLSNSTIRDYISAIKSKHTLLVADACFSGGIFKTRTAFSNAPKSVKEVSKIPSRKAMTSGTLKEVPDKSVFVKYLLKRLNENSEEYLTSEKLYSSLKDAVINNSPNSQVPQFGEIHETGDEGGDFVFVKR